MSEDLRMSKFQVVNKSGEICFDGRLFDTKSEAWDFVYEACGLLDYVFKDFQLIEVD